MIIIFGFLPISRALAVRYIHFCGWLTTCMWVIKKNVFHIGQLFSGINKISNIQFVVFSFMKCLYDIAMTTNTLVRGSKKGKHISFSSAGEQCSIFLPSQEITTLSEHWIAIPYLGKRNQVQLSLSLSFEG